MKKPQIKRHISQAAYRLFPAVSRSELFAISRSPQFYRWQLEHPDEAKSDAFRLGSALHLKVLQPGEFDDYYFCAAAMPKRTTKEGKAKWSEIEEQALGREILTLDEAVLVNDMATSVKTDPLASVLFSGGEAETSIFWEDAITGEAVKVRPDYLRDIGDKILVTDLKTTRDASTEGFKKEAFRFGYPLQAAMYSEGIELAFGKSVEFYFVAVEKEAPFAVNVFKADELFIRYGQEQLRELLGIYHDCKESGKWYGYTGFSGQVQTLSLPNGILKNYL